MKNKELLKSKEQIRFDLEKLNPKQPKQQDVETILRKLFPEQDE